MLVETNGQLSTCMFGASGGVLGTARAQYQLRQIMISPHLPPQVVILSVLV